jgi:long-chain acyl-CoA synthetase
VRRRETMEVHAATPRDAATGSKTLADLLPLAVAKHGSLIAQRFKDKASGEWQDVSYEELGEIVKEASLGLQDNGIKPGDKLPIRAHTRPGWGRVYTN